MAVTRFTYTRRAAIRLVDAEPDECCDVTDNNGPWGSTVLRSYITALDVGYVVYSDQHDSSVSVISC